MGTKTETEGERVLTEGEYALRVYRVIEIAAAAGQRAPSHDDIAEKVKVPRGSLRRIIAKLVSTGLVEIRSDGRAQYRRAYRIVETGARTKGFDEGHEVGPRPSAAELVIEVLRAAHGRRAPTLTELTRRAHLALSVVSKAIEQLKDEGRLEVRAEAQCGRRRCYHVVETGEKTEGFDKGLELRPAKRQATGGIGIGNVGFGCDPGVRAASEETEAGLPELPAAVRERRRAQPHVPGMPARRTHL